MLFDVILQFLLQGFVVSQSLFLGLLLTSQLSQACVFRAEFQRPAGCLQLASVWRGRCLSLLPLLLVVLKLFQTAAQLFTLDMPLVFLAQRIDLHSCSLQLRGKLRGFILQSGFLLLRQQLRALLLSQQKCKLLFLLAEPLVHRQGDIAIDGGAGYLFQYRRAVIGCGSQEGGKPTLGQQHGLREPGEVHAGQLYNSRANSAQLAVDDFPGLCIHNFMSGGLQFAVRFFACAVLCPERAIATLLRAEGNFRKTLAALARHDFIAGGSDGTKPRCLSIKRQTHRIKQRAFAGTGGADNGKNSVTCVGRVCEVDFPFAKQGVQVLKAYAQNAHVYSARRSAVCMSLTISL